MNNKKFIYAPSKKSAKMLENMGLKLLKKTTNGAWVFVNDNKIQLNFNNNHELIFSDTIIF